MGWGITHNGLWFSSYSSNRFSLLLKFHYRGSVVFDHEGHLCPNALTWLAQAEMTTGESTEVFWFFFEFKLWDYKNINPQAFLHFLLFLLFLLFSDQSMKSMAPHTQMLRLYRGDSGKIKFDILHQNPCEKLKVLYGEVGTSIIAYKKRAQCAVLFNAGHLSLAGHLVVQWDIFDLHGQRTTPHNLWFSLFLIIFLFHLFLTFLFLGTPIVPSLASTTRFSASM